MIQLTIRIINIYPKTTKKNIRDETEERNQKPLISQKLPIAVNAEHRLGHEIRSSPEKCKMR